MANTQEIQFKKECLTTTLIQEILPMADDHFKETVGIEGEPPPHVSWETYEALQRQNILHTFTARCRETLAGYAFFKVVCHPHHLNPPVMIAIMDRIYLSPDYRGKGWGSVFIKFTEDELKPFAKSIMQHVTSRNDFSPTLLKLGYAETAVIYTKNI